LKKQPYWFSLEMDWPEDFFFFVAVQLQFSVDFFDALSGVPRFSGFSRSRMPALVKFFLIDGLFPQAFPFSILRFL